MASKTARAPKPAPRPTYQLISGAPNAKARKVVLAGLIDYNSLHVGPALWKQLAVFLKDGSGRVRGGLVGYSFWQWTHIELFWLAEKYRRQGHGSKMLRLAEQEARRRGCIGMTVDTTSFQAPRFYPKLGFKVYAAIEDYPPGHKRFYLMKRLDA